MCGVVGYAALDPRRTPDPAPLAAMLGAVAHRGPDDEGRHVAEGIVLGHRRLSVIDVEHGHQPIAGERPGTLAVANGEIYNYRALGRQLHGLGHTLRTGSDTEVAAHAYDAWDLDFLRRLDGMFALALWDAERRRLVLARDPMGEKPLYTCVADGLLLFASELSALLRHPAVPREIDPAALSAYLALEYVPAPASLLRGVRKLAPGTALVLEDGSIREHAYWSVHPRVPDRPGDYPEAVARLRGLLEDAVTSRLVSDVPLGVFLSGGIDSGTVAALAARQGPVRTFSIGFAEASFDESRWARLVADHIGAEHSTRVLEAARMPDLVPDVVRLLDEPLADASLLPTWLLSAFARESVTVALGGDGGDELFAGYPMHQAHRVAAAFRRLPRPAHRALRAAAARLPVSDRNFAFGFKARTFLRGAAAEPPENHGLWMASFPPAEQQRLLTRQWRGAVEPGDAFATLHRAWTDSAGAPLLARARHLDAVTYLPNDILTKVDRASMAVALEVRAPFLARDVVDFAFSLPDAWVMRGLTGKRILRDAVVDLLPPAILDRPKKGFGIPLAAWLRGPLLELARDLLSRERLAAAGIFEPDAVGRLLDAHVARRADHRKALWTLIVFEIWRERLCRPAARA